MKLFGFNLVQTNYVFCVFLIKSFMTQDQLFFVFNQIIRIVIVRAYSSGVFLILCIPEFPVLMLRSCSCVREFFASYTVKRLFFEKRAMCMYVLFVQRWKKLSMRIFSAAMNDMIPYVSYHSSCIILPILSQRIFFCVFNPI